MCQTKFIIWTWLAPVKSVVKVPMLRHGALSYTGAGIAVVGVGTMTMVMSGPRPRPRPPSLGIVGVFYNRAIIYA